MQLMVVSGNWTAIKNSPI